MMRNKPFVKGNAILFSLLILMTSVSGVVLANENDFSNEDAYISEIDAFMTNEIERLKIPGASLAIVKGDQVKYLQGYGFADWDGTEMTAQTPIVLGSTSKAFTALAIMQLVEQGKVTLEEPVQSYIPWFQLEDHDESSKITIQH